MRRSKRVGADRAGIRFLVAFGRKSPQCLPTAAAVGARGAGSRAAHAVGRNRVTAHCFQEEDLRLRTGLLVCCALAAMDVVAAMDGWRGQRVPFSTSHPPPLAPDLPATSFRPRLGDARCEISNEIFACPVQGAHRHPPQPRSLSVACYMLFLMYGLMHGYN